MSEGSDTTPASSTNGATPSTADIERRRKLRARVRAKLRMFAVAMRGVREVQAKLARKQAEHKQMRLMGTRAMTRDPSTSEIKEDRDRTRELVQMQLAQSHARKRALSGDFMDPTQASAAQRQAEMRETKAKLEAARFAAWRAEVIEAEEWARSVTEATRQARELPAESEATASPVAVLLHLQDFVLPTRQRCAAPTIQVTAARVWATLADWLLPGRQRNGHSGRRQKSRSASGAQSDSRAAARARNPERIDGGH